MLVSEARAEFEQRKKDTSDIDAIPGTFLKWCNYINRYAYKRLANIMPENFIKEQTYNVVGGTQNYALPTDFQDIIPKGTGMYEVNDSGEPTDRRLAGTSYGSVQNGMYINLTSIVVTPKPTGSKQYIFRYIPLLTDLSADTGVFIIPTRFSEHIMNALDTCYNIWDEDQQAEVFNDERFVNSLNELIALIKPDAQVEGLPDFSGDF